MDVVLKEIMKFISEGNMLPDIICDWLETVPMQDEFKKFISLDVDDNKSNLLIDCLKLKGNFYNYKYVIIFYIISYIILYFFRKYCVQEMDDSTFGSCTYKSHSVIDKYVETNI